MHRYHNEIVTYNLRDSLPAEPGRRNLQNNKSAQQVATMDDRLPASVQYPHHSREIPLHEEVYRQGVFSQGLMLYFPSSNPSHYLKKKRKIN